ncbi:1-acyl-sn-glycerol-3-phosphate acyltransferase [Parahaliea sp. F7430]|uniref:1-acyl-sn-glycerol-3-phosphate acyltransferase n=1 Tax=Sediminihaliea albiluteola TaxID=2758564 RepID=A0A7W2TWJ0_9GAMM|nr:1-acyl-sn-glycerol-3-phosphate acyltransferase [Sediminihaliea albiluteola]MBA6413244.1 1-acyl-sn-glycerol-3-phosphate acyltransferase [Sediminihaliea albiluteola]
MNDPFSDIRPYRDDEVTAVLARLLQDPELLGALASLRLGRLARVAPALSRALVRIYLSRQLRDVHDVQAMQMVVKAYVEQMIEDSTAGFTVSGLEQLDATRPYLFMSNHRDIAMDPAFTNYALHVGGHNTVRIAIGDNLLTKPWVSDLMRLNKSFIVKRSVSGPRELLTASKTLSNYIRHSLLEENAPIWIAQREGRAKNGIDRTEPAVIKMLSMSRDKETESFAEHIRKLGIVPVSISYELDPCDEFKAKELYQVESTGEYKKAEQEDIASIGRGISGAKGRVHVAFGSPLDADYESASDVARAVDEQIISLYCLHPTNLYAYQMLHGEAAALPQQLDLASGSCSQEQFRARIAALPEAHQPYALATYANAVVAKLAQAQNGDSLAE